MADVRDTTAKNLYYQGLLTLAAAGAGAVAILVLARVLSPAEFGIAGFALLLSNTGERAADFGISAAMLSRREELGATLADASTLRLTMALAVTAVLATVAILMEGTLSTNGVGGLLLPLAFVPLVSGLGFASQVQLRLDLDFRRLSMAQCGAALGMPAAQATMALAGFGAWSIVLGVIAGHLAQFALLALLRPVFPRPSVNLRAWKGLLGFGSKAMGTAAMQEAFDVTCAWMVSAFAGAAWLGAYLLAQRLTTLVPYRAFAIVNEVMLPTASGMRARGEDIGPAYLEGIRAVALPAALANAVAIPLALPGVLFIGGANWELAVPAIQLLAVWGVLLALAQAASPFLLAHGLPGSTFWQAFMAFVVAAAAGPGVIPYFGLPGFALVLAVTAGLQFTFVATVVRRHGGPTQMAAVRAAAPVVLICSAAALTVGALLTIVALPPGPAIAVGAVVYFAAAFATDHFVFHGRIVADVRRFARSVLPRRAAS